VSFYVSTATFFLPHCDEWDRVVALPRHKFVTGATLLQLGGDKHSEIDGCNISKTISFKFWILKYGSPISEWLWFSLFEYMNRH
jgi:hypothetical protein